MKRRYSLIPQFLAASAMYLGLGLAHAQPAPPAGGPEGGPPRMGPPPPGGPMMMGPGQRGMEMHGMGPGAHRSAPFLRGLRLSEEQQDRVFDIMHKLAPQLRNSEKTLRKSHAALRAMSESGNFDDAAARNLAQSIGQASADLALMRARAEQQIFALLSPEQRKQVQERKGPPDGGRPDGPPPRR